MDLQTTAVLLVISHLLADYAWQGDFMAKAKNHRTPIPGVPWLTVLLSHAGIHASLVFLVTDNIWLALIELAGHAIIDHAKCSCRISYNVDQLLHLLMKGGYVLFLFW